MLRTKLGSGSVATSIQLLRRSCISLQNQDLLNAEFRLPTPRECLEMRMTYKTAGKRYRKTDNNSAGHRLKNGRTIETAGRKSRHRVSSGVPSLPKAKTMSDVIRPVAVQPEMQGGPNFGEEMTQKLDAAQLKQVLSQVKEDNDIQHLLQQELNVDDSMVQIMLQSFVQYCLLSNNLPADLHVCLHDLIQNAGIVTDLLPFIIDHGRQVYPHVDVMEDLKHLCVTSMADPVNWFPEARKMKRKIIYHSGPTNSGKTYAALQRYMEAETGVYLAPLRLLAIECFTKTNSQDVQCDLLTGERKYYMVSEDQPSNHKSCTIELLDYQAKYEVAVIDEIQMIGDINRGGHWTMALLGVMAEEIHVCGSGSALSIVENLVKKCGDEFEVKNYERKTPLVVQKEPLGDLENVKPGDCIVCFSIAEVFKTAKKLCTLGHNCALIYGALPPGVKIKQTELFNDPKSACDILVATDAVGMGLNLSIQRVVFSDIKKIDLKENEGELIDRYSKQKQVVSTTQAKQIAGRAGRYGGIYEDTGGEVTTFKEDDLTVLRKLLDEEIPDIKRAGLTLRENIVEAFAYYLPGMLFSRILMLFIAMCETNKPYFMCDMSSMVTNAMLIDHIPMPLVDKFIFCQAPLRHTVSPKGVAMFIQMARHISEGKPLNLNWFLRTSRFDMSELENMTFFDDGVELFHLSDVYLWLSFKFDLFKTVEDMREFRIKLDKALRNYMETNYTNIDHRKLLNQQHASKNLKNFIIGEILNEGDNFEKELDQTCRKNEKSKGERKAHQEEMNVNGKDAEKDILARIWYNNGIESGGKIEDSDIEEELYEQNDIPAQLLNSDRDLRKSWAVKNSQSQGNDVLASKLYCDNKYLVHGSKVEDSDIEKEELYEQNNVPAQLLNSHRDLRKSRAIKNSQSQGNDVLARIWYSDKKDIEYGGKVESKELSKTKDAMTEVWHDVEHIDTGRIEAEEISEKNENEVLDKYIDNKLLTEHKDPLAATWYGDEQDLGRGQAVKDLEKSDHGLSDHEENFPKEHSGLKGFRYPRELQTPPPVDTTYTGRKTKRVAKSNEPSEKGRQRSHVVSMDDVIDHFIELSLSMENTRILAKTLSFATDEEKDACLKKVLPSIYELSTKHSGCLVVQKLIEVCTLEQKGKIVQQLAENILPLSYNRFGTYVIETALKTVGRDMQTELVKGLQDHVLECAKDETSYENLLHCMNCMDPKDLQFIVDGFHGKVLDVSVDRYSSLVLIKTIKYFPKEQTQPLLEEMVDYLGIIAKNAYGNFVIQELLKHGNSCQIRPIFERILDEIDQLAFDKYGCYVIQKVCSVGQPEQVQLVLESLHEHIEKLFYHEHGCHIIKSLLKHGQSEQMQHVNKFLMEHTERLAFDPNGRKIIQDVLEHGQSDEVEPVLEVLLKHTEKMCFDVEGYHVMRYVLKRRQPDQTQPFKEVLVGLTETLAYDEYGSQILTIILEHGQPEEIQCFSDHLLEHTETLALHEFGCTVLKYMLTYSGPETANDLRQKLFKNAEVVVQDEYGANVLLHLIDLGKPEDTRSIIQRIGENIVMYSQHEHARLVAMKCLDDSSDVDRISLIQQVCALDDSSMISMVNDKFSSQVVEMMLYTAEPPQRRELESKILAHASMILKNENGKHILEVINSMRSLSDSTEISEDIELRGFRYFKEEKRLNLKQAALHWKLSSPKERVDYIDRARFSLTDQN